MILYIIIFLSKVIENALGTLRMIVVTNGKKMLGAVLQALIALVWVLVAGAVIVDVKSDPLKVVFYALGSAVGSYLGSFLEEKLALGNSIMTVVVNNNEEKLIKNLRDANFGVTKLEGEGATGSKAVLLIGVTRKKLKDASKIVKDIDESAMILTGGASSISGGIIN